MAIGPPGSAERSTSALTARVARHLQLFESPQGGIIGSALILCPWKFRCNSGRDMNRSMVLSDRFHDQAEQSVSKCIRDSNPSKTKGKIGFYVQDDASGWLS